MSPRGSRLAHHYGLSRTHKVTLEMRPILSATNTYNYKLAIWLGDKLKPFRKTRHVIDDIFEFADWIKQKQVYASDIMVSYDVTALFTNVTVDETINYIVEKAFAGNWFNETYDLNLTKEQLNKLLEIATKGQLFQFDGKLYQQIDRVAMGSPLGPLMANAIMCKIEEKLQRDGTMPEDYYRYVDDTFNLATDIIKANTFHQILNDADPPLAFPNKI